MITENSISIDAPAALVWDVFTNAEHWPEWTASVQRIVALDGVGIDVGNRFEIKQPRFPELVWEVTEVEPGAAWTWRQRSFGSSTVATHDVVAEAPDRTRMRQRIDQRGPLGVVVGLLGRRLTRRYLDLEAHGLKGRSEQSLKARSERRADAARA